MTPKLVQQFEEDGYLTGIRVYEETDVARIRGAFDQLEAREGRDRCEIGLQGRHVDERFIWELASHPRILDYIESLIGPDILVLSTHFFCKYPGDTEKFVAWHQDVTYWGLAPSDDIVTAWYAIDDSNTENGCLRVIPASHRWGLLNHGRDDRGGNLLSIKQVIQDARLDENRAVDLVLKTGQISIHHGHLIHGSEPNRSNRRRCGLTIRYCPPHVRPVHSNSTGRPWKAVLVRGVDHHKNFGEWNLQFDE